MRGAKVGRAQLPEYCVVNSERCVLVGPPRGCTAFDCSPSQRGDGARSRSRWRLTGAAPRQPSNASGVRQRQPSVPQVESCVPSSDACLYFVASLGPAQGKERLRAPAWRRQKRTQKVNSAGLKTEEYAGDAVGATRDKKRTSCTTRGAASLHEWGVKASPPLRSTVQNVSVVAHGGAQCHGRWFPHVT